MYHRGLFVGIFVLLCCEHALSSKENHEHGFKRNSKNPSSRRKHIGLKHCGPMKCNIICPIEVIVPHPSCNGPPSYPPVPLAPGLPVPASEPATAPTESTTVEVSTQPSPPPGGNPPPPPPNNNQNGPIKAEVADFINQVFPNKTDQSERHRLKHHNRKHSHFKKLVLANRSGKKAYKFRQMTSSCYVSCQSPEFSGPTEVHQDPGIDYNPQPEDVGGPEPEQQEESDDDGPYVEGEDAPVEVTREPGTVLKAWNRVDFEGLDDFGADGRPAGDSAEPAEDKKKLGKKN